MTKITAQKVAQLIASHPDVVRFGRETDRVDESWIVKAEEKLGLTFSASYKWFLRTYAGGEIGTEEIYSVYGMEFESVNGGDIVYRHIVGRKSNLTDEKKLVVSETDMGEFFFFDYSKSRDDECPLNIGLPSGEGIFYAVDFYEFLYKRIADHI